MRLCCQRGGGGGADRFPPRRPLQLFTLPASQCRPRKQNSGRDVSVPHDSVSGWSRARAESHRQVFDAVGGPTRRKLTTHVSAENDRGMWVPDDRLVEMNDSQSLPIDTRGNDSRPVMGVPREDPPGIFQNQSGSWLKKWGNKPAVEMITVARNADRTCDQHVRGSFQFLGAPPWLILPASAPPEWTTHGSHRQHE